MSFDSLVGQVEVSGDGDPLERLAGKIFPDVFVVRAQVFVGRSGSFFFGGVVLVLLVGVGRGDDDVVLAVELVGSGGVLLVDEVLLLELELELVLLVGLHRHVDAPESQSILTFIRG